MKEIIRNDAGKAFSAWKPAEKYQFMLSRNYPHIFKQCALEYRFHDLRKWRFDFAWPKMRIAVEVDGMGYGHQAVNRIHDNNLKRNTAVCDGWQILVFDSKYLGSKNRVEDAAELTAQLICGALPKSARSWPDDEGL